MTQPVHEPDKDPRPAAKAYRGEVVHIYAFDIAHEMVRQPVTRLLGQPVTQFAVGVTKHSPRQFFFFRPEMVRLPEMQRVGPGGPVSIKRTVKVFPVGAISIAVHIPFEVDRIEDLAVYHELRFGDRLLVDSVRQLAEDVRRDLEPYCRLPVAKLSEPEAYTVFCFSYPLPGEGADAHNAQAWLARNRRPLAGLLTEEEDFSLLSEQELEESTTLHLSYHEHDLSVIDWNAALIVDDVENFDEMLHVMELANVQLAELETYDRILDGTLERSYRDLSGGRLRVRFGVLGNLREIRVDLARLADELSNITKFFGDWHLARVYQHLSTRFHLADWHRTISQKLRTLDELYQILKQDKNNLWMLILEASVVVLFVLDLVALVLSLKH